MITNFFHPVSLHVDAGAINRNRFQDLESGQTEVPVRNMLDIQLADYGRRLFQVTP